MDDPSCGLVERQHLLAEVSALWEAVAEGRSTVLVLEGGVGTGKTAALCKLYQAARTRPGAVVRYVSCAPEEAAVPLGVAHQLLRPPGAVAAGAGADGPGRHDPGARTNLVQELSALVDVGSPVALFLDDAYWCDEPSLQVLTQLAHRMLHQPLLIVLTSTLDPAELGDLLGVPNARVRRLVPLSRAGAEQLCRATFPRASDEFVTACHAVSDGVPLFLSRLVEMLAAGTGQGSAPPVEAVQRCVPPGLARRVIRQTRRDGPLLERAVRCLAVFHGPVSLEEAAQVMGTGLADAADAVSEIRRLGLADADGGIMLRPALARLALMRDLRPSGRHELAARAAAALAPNACRLLAAGRHLIDTYPSGSARNVELLLAAAQRDDGVGMFDESGVVALLRRALAEPPQTPDQHWRVLTGLAAAELAASDVDEAIDHLARALEVAPDRESRLRCRLALAYALLARGRVEEVTCLVEVEVEAEASAGPLAADGDVAGDLAVGRAGELAGELAETRWFAAFEHHVAGVADVADAAGEAGEAGEAVVRPAGGLDGADLRASTARVAAAFRAAVRGEAVRPVGPLGPTVADDDGGPLTAGFPISLMSGLIHLWSGDLEAVERLLYRWERTASRGTALDRALGSWLSGMVAVHSGRLGAALGRVADIEELLGADPEWGFRHLGPLLALEIAAEGGDQGTAERLLSAHGLCGELPRRWSFDLLLAARGQLRVHGTDHQRGVWDLCEAGRRLESIGCTNPAAASWRSCVALAYSRTGREDDARALVEQEVELADRWGAPRSRAISLLRRAAVLGGPRGLADCDAALAIADQRQLPLVRARVLLVQGRLHRRASKSADARAGLTQALELARGCQAVRLTDDICQELLAVGGRPRVRNSLPTRQLTDGESRVVSLVVQGWTNEQIARKLYLARRTVEAHLTSVYRKLGIRGRSQLATAVGRQELG